MVRGIPARRACSGKRSIDLPPDLSNLAPDNNRKGNIPVSRLSTSGNDLRRLMNELEELGERRWRKTMHRLLIRTLAVLTLFGIAVPAAAQDFYRGKTVNLIVGNAAGGGYDLYARL